MVILIQQTTGNSITMGYCKYCTCVITGMVFASMGMVWANPDPWYIHAKPQVHTQTSGHQYHHYQDDQIQIGNTPEKSQ